VTAQAPGPAAPLLLRGGTVLDVVSGERRRADLGVAGGRVLLSP